MKSFVELTKILLGIDGVKCILSDKYSQDPLEEHFTRQRRRAGCSENPSLYRFGQQELALNVMKSELITDLTGNTRGRGVDKPNLDINDLRELPRKKKKPEEQ